MSLRECCEIVHSWQFIWYSLVSKLSELRPASFDEGVHPNFPAIYSISALTVTIPLCLCSLSSSLVWVNLLAVLVL
jgi:hypothetical protein